MKPETYQERAQRQLSCWCRPCLFVECPACDYHDVECYRCSRQREGLQMVQATEYRGEDTYSVFHHHFVGTCEHCQQVFP